MKQILIYIYELNLLEDLDLLLILIVFVILILNFEVDFVLLDLLVLNLKVLKHEFHKTTTRNINIIMIIYQYD